MVTEGPLAARHWARPWDVRMSRSQAPAFRELKTPWCRSHKDKLVRISPEGCKSKEQNAARN